MPQVGRSAQPSPAAVQSRCLHTAHRPHLIRSSKPWRTAPVCVIHRTVFGNSASCRLFCRLRPAASKHIGLRCTSAADEPSPSNTTSPAIGNEVRSARKGATRDTVSAPEGLTIPTSKQACRPALTADQPVPSTSNRETAQIDEESLTPELRQAMAMIPFAGLSIGSYHLSLRDLTAKKLAKAWSRFMDTVNYAEILPPVGSQQLSYAKFLELLSKRKIKRIILMDNATCAIVEVPVEGYAASYRVPLSKDRLEESITYSGGPTAEWDMEKMRYYVELPGDLYEDGYFMDLVKVNMAPLRDEHGRVDHNDLLLADQTYLELQVIDHSDANQFLDAFQGQLLPIIAIVLLRIVVTVGTWMLGIFGRRTTNKQDMIDEYSKFKGTLYNVEGGKSGTGVRYEDVAGIEHAMELVEESIEMLLGDSRYRTMGAKPPRGILMEGPPGTGKTFLAKAMAGESGLPFISTNGSEFVEMFEGVAASRVRDLFKTARKVAPAIVFIDEIDAIGKARGEGGGGSRERESGLMQMLYEMDSVTRDDQILVIGATNRRDALDDALLRPGRFDRFLYMGLPSTRQRFKILQVHARNKAVPHGGDEVWPEDALLHRTAELTINYSGAELANLLNEAAILMVRKEQTEISLALIREVMDKRVMGTAGSRLPDSEAKRRLAMVAAARAVVVATTPGMPPLQRMSILPRGDNITRTLFMPQDATTLPRLWQPGKQNAVEITEPLSPYEMLTGLLVPLYAARAAEEAFYGPRGVTLSTSKEVAEAGILASFLVMKSSLFPAYRDLAVAYAMSIGGREDPTTERLDPEFEQHTLSLQRAAHAIALRQVRARRPAIEAVAREMCASSDDTILGHRIVEIIEAADVQPDTAAMPSEAGAQGAAIFAADGAGRVGTVSFATPPATATAVPPQLSGAAAVASFSGTGEGRSGQARFGSTAVDFHLVSNEAVQAALEVVVGRSDMAELTGIGYSAQRLAEVRAQLENSDWVERVKAVRKYARSSKPAADFPQPPPEVPELRGHELENWINPEAREPIIVS